MSNILIFIFILLVLLFFVVKTGGKAFKFPKLPKKKVKEIPIQYYTIDFAANKDVPPIEYRTIIVGLLTNSILRYRDFGNLIKRDSELRYLPKPGPGTECLKFAIVGECTFYKFELKENYDYSGSVILYLDKVCNIKHHCDIDKTQGAIKCNLKTFVPHISYM